MYKKPKVNGYLLFMQEMRKTQPGWAKKGNPELQLLCGPLWTKLSKEEKEKYKIMKKEIKFANKVKMVEQRKADEARRVKAKEADSWHKFFTAERTRVYLMDVLAITKVRVGPEKEIKKIQKFLASEDLELVPVNPDLVSIGLQALARYSEDNTLYRCRVVDIMEDRMKVIKHFSSIFLSC